MVRFRAVKVLCVLGTRPDAIKMAPVVHALRTLPDLFETRVCVTAQHRELLDPLVRFFDLRPDHDLNVMTPGQSLGELTVALLRQLTPMIDTEQPDVVVVQGDTTSSFCAALAAFHAGSAVAHVEAGLRTGRNDQPFPEEANRRLISCVTKHHFAPTDLARAHLIGEGVPDDAITVTGNTAIDALHWTLARATPVSEDLLAPAGGHTILVTLHRRESFGPPLEAMCEALLALATRAGARAQFVCTVHPNPNVSAVLRHRLGGVPGIRLIEPLDYPDFVGLLARCHFVVTDSGGLQEEAPALGKPVLVLRDHTERPEGVSAGAAQLVGRSPEAIVTAVMRLLDEPAAYERMSRSGSPYGDGHAASRIVDALARRMKPLPR